MPLLASLSPLVLAQNAPDVPFPACPDGQELLFSTNWISNTTSNHGVDVSASVTDILAQQDGIDLNILGPACLYDGAVFDMEIQGLPSLSTLSLYVQWIFRGTWDGSPTNYDELVIFRWGPDVDGLDEVLQTSVASWPDVPMCLPQPAPCATFEYGGNHSSPYWHHYWARGSGNFDRFSLWESWKHWENPSSDTWWTRVAGQGLEDPCDNEDLAVRNVMVCGTLQEDIDDPPPQGFGPVLTLIALIVGGVVLAGAIAGFLLRGTNSDPSSSSSKKGQENKPRVMSSETSMTRSPGRSNGKAGKRAPKEKGYTSVPIKTFKPQDDDMITIQTQVSTTSSMAPFF